MRRLFCKGDWRRFLFLCHVGGSSSKPSFPLVYVKICLFIELLFVKSLMPVLFYFMFILFLVEMLWAETDQGEKWQFGGKAEEIDLHKTLCNLLFVSGSHLLYLSSFVIQRSFTFSWIWRGQATRISTVCAFKNMLYIFVYVLNIICILFTHFRYCIKYMKCALTKSEFPFDSLGHFSKDFFKISVENVNMRTSVFRR